MAVTGICVVPAGLQEFVQGSDRGGEEGEFLDEELDELPGPSYPEPPLRE